MRQFLCLTAAPVVALLVLALLLTSCSHDAPAAPVRTYAMGDKVEVGRVIYRVFEAQWMTQIPATPSPRIPQHRFLVIRLAADNAGSGDVLVPGLSIEADNGNTFTELSSGEGVDQWLGILRKVKAGENIGGKVLFDAPPQHYKLRISDESSETAALVDIPLNLNAEAPPPVVIPDGKK